MCFAFSNLFNTIKHVLHVKTSATEIKSLNITINLLLNLKLKGPTQKATALIFNNMLFTKLDLMLQSQTCESADYQFHAQQIWQPMTCCINKIMSMFPSTGTCKLAKQPAQSLTSHNVGYEIICLYSRCIGRIEEANEVAKELSSIAHHQVQGNQRNKTCTPKVQAYALRQMQHNQQRKHHQGVCLSKFINR